MSVVTPHLARHRFLHFFLFAKGISEYRDGNYSSAIEAFARARTMNNSSDHFLDMGLCLFRAMAHHKLDEPEQSDQFFREANEVSLRWLPQRDSQDFGGGWADWLICEIARREARQVLGKDAE